MRMKRRMRKTAAKRARAFNFGEQSQFGSEQCGNRLCKHSATMMRGK